MPENIKTFKILVIRHLDDQVHSFLNKIKSLLTNVYLTIGPIKSAKNMHILFTHLLPMLGGIRGIRCDHNNVPFFGYFPGALAPVKELDLLRTHMSFIPATLDWLSIPQDIGEHGPRFLTMNAESQTIVAFIDAVRKQFLTATTSTTFVIFLQQYECRHRSDELTFENAATKEELTVRNAHFKWLKHGGIDIHYVEIVRHPTGANAKMREWIEKRAFYEKEYEANKEIWIDEPTIGAIPELLCLFLLIITLVLVQSPRERCEFPETEMPENICGFKRLTIRYLDDQVLDFLGKIKPLFANVYLDIGSLQSEPDMQKVFDLSSSDMRTLLGHLLPMIASIRRITCYNYNHCVEFLERQLPGTLALAKELNLLYADTTSIPAYLDWLCTPQHFDQHGPRFLTASADFDIITAIVDAVRQQFLAATTRATFVIFIEHNRTEQHNEFTIENATTNEKLTVRKGQAKWLHRSRLDYVQIVRNPMGADARMQEWIEERAYYQQKHNNLFRGTLTEQQQPMICVGPWLTIGQITKQAVAMDQAKEDKSDGNAAAGPSSSSAKKTSCV